MRVLSKYGSWLIRVCGPFGISRLVSTLSQTISNVQSGFVFHYLILFVLVWFFHYFIFFIFLSVLMFFFFDFILPLALTSLCLPIINPILNLEIVNNSLRTLQKEKNKKK